MSSDSGVINDIIIHSFVFKLVEANSVQKLKDLFERVFMDSDHNPHYITLVCVLKEGRRVADIFARQEQLILRSAFEMGVRDDDDEDRAGGGGGGGGRGGTKRDRRNKIKEQSKDKDGDTSDAGGGGGRDRKPKRGSKPDFARQQQLILAHDKILMSIIPIEDIVTQPLFVEDPFAWGRLLTSSQELKDAVRTWISERSTEDATRSDEPETDSKVDELTLAYQFSGSNDLLREQNVVRPCFLKPALEKVDDGVVTGL